MTAPSRGRAAQLARRRERLVERSAHLRGRVHEQLQGVQPALAWADRLQDAWLWLRAHPLPVAGAVLVLTVWRPRRALALTLRLWSGWQLLQRVRSIGNTRARLG